MTNDNGFTFDQLREEVLKIDPHAEGRAMHEEVAVLAMSLGANDEEIATETSIPVGEIRDMRANLANGGVIIGDEFLNREWFDEGGSVSFHLDVNVAKGYAVRVDGTDSEARYRLTDKGIARAQELIGGAK